MKKRLESELISIAHRILKLKNKSEVDQLYKETQKLYETLSVLKFYQDNFESIKSDVTQDDLEEKLDQSKENTTPSGDVEPIAEVVLATEPEIVEEELIQADEDEETPETVFEDEESSEEEIVIEPEVDEEEPVFKPIFELEVEEEEQIEPAELASEVKPEAKQVSFEELLGENYADTVFVKPDEVSLFSADPNASQQKKQTNKENEEKSVSSKSIEIGLNDRVAFVNNLFGESNEDFNRVISQLNTFDTFEEAKNFINEMVIPDYNYWVGKEDYLERFMEIVEKKFN
ncbi:hypothetical protein [Flavobacterium sp.]|jgi:hypothetical protein|uniref:hypothetical protein n=1 Tax=Flavobacterium sp. TaxID=239 RepID=UPI0037BF9A69